MNLKTNQKGFTIVELLIVIVVIAILAAISIVAYTGIQDRARTSTGQQLAAQVQTKAQAFYTVASAYPGNYAAFDAVKEAKLEGMTTGQLKTTENLADKADADSGKKVSYFPCGTATTATVENTANVSTYTGARISYWDFTENKLVTKNVGTGCPALP